MRSNRLVDFVVLGLLISGAAYYFTAKPEKPTNNPNPAVAATASPAAPNTQFPDKALPFSLPRVDGSTLQYRGKGPVAITLTAVGCGGCRERIPRDKELLKLTREKGVPLYNVLVFSPDAQAGRQFVDQFQPEADEIVVDPGGQVFVNQYLGSDNNCWMLIGPQGEFIYRGPENMQAMKTGLAQLQAEGFNGQNL